MQLVLSEDDAERVAKRALTGAAITLKHDGDLGSLAGVLDGPCYPLDHIIVEHLVASAEHHLDVLLEQAPITLLWLNTKAAPKVELPIDDLRLTRLERHAAILSPVGMFEPPTADIHPLGFLFVTDIDVPVQIEIAEVLETQIDRLQEDVVHVAGNVMHLREAQHPCLATLHHHGVLGVELVEDPLPLTLSLGHDFRARLLCLPARIFFGSLRLIAAVVT